MISTSYRIHPSVGIARVGNSRESFYLAPESIGGLPIEADASGNAILDENGRPVRVHHFKDATGRLRRQGARFEIFAYDEASPEGREVTLDDPAVASIEWTVHLANKKAVWYQTQELTGDLMLGKEVDGQNTNSYTFCDVPFRNAGVTEHADRQALIIDPGPRSVNDPLQVVDISRDNAPPDYKHVSFPPPKLGPYPIDTLGRLQMDAQGRLIVLGGYGRASGATIISTYTGGDQWWDDISDGPVTCKLTLRDGQTVALDAWVIVGPPKFAPELRNLGSLDDVMYDVGVRYMDLVPELYHDGKWSDSFRADFDRDIRPIIERLGDYLWVANVQFMAAFASPRFDVTDASEANRANRERYFSYWRNPSRDEASPSHQVLFRQGVPMMPVNSGSNSVTNTNIDKFMSLTQTQYQFLKLWAEGRFEYKPAQSAAAVHALNRASVGNAVGHPMSPGIEVSWNLRNPVIYERPYVIQRRDHDYRESGLSTGRDECEGGGCEPGDLTKRMSPPWQSDMYQCFIQYINFTDPKRNQDAATQIPVPPTYYAYWWPPQMPVYVISGVDTAAEQSAAGVAAGYQVYFSRGADNIRKLINSWKYMGFILNQNEGPDRHLFPYFVERERNHDRFVPAAVAVGQPINELAASGSYFTGDNYFVPVWYPRDPHDLG